MLKQTEYFWIWCLKNLFERRNRKYAILERKWRQIYSKSLDIGEIVCFMCFYHLLSRSIQTWSTRSVLEWQHSHQESTSRLVFTSGSGEACFSHPLERKRACLSRERRGEERIGVGSHRGLPSRHRSRPTCSLDQQCSKEK